jgi:spore coat protein CotH
MTHRIAAAAVLATAVSCLPAQVPDFYDMDTVRDVYLTFGQANYWTLLTNNYASATNIAADMTVDGRTYPSVGVRFRGNTSYTQLPTGSQKKGFNIEMDWIVASQDVYGYDSLNFNNGFHDPTFLREPMTYYIMRRHGVAPKANWIRLWLNGQYWGVYINVQQPNKDMMKEWFRSNDGNRYRCFPTSGGFSNGRCAYTVLSPNTAASYLSAYQAKQGNGVDLMNLCGVLNGMTTATPQSTLTTVFNVDSFYRYAAVMNVTTNTDSYLESGKDHFLYMDEVHGDGTTFPFDLNESMLGSTTLAPDYATTNTFRPAFTKTLQFADWTQRYKAHLRAVLDQTFNPTFLTPKFQQYHAMLLADVTNDTKKLYTTAQYTTNLTASITTTIGSMGGGSITVPGIVPFLSARHTYLNTHAYFNATRATLSNLAHSPTTPTPSQNITVTVQASAAATAVNLYWRKVGRFLKESMFDDGLHGDGAANDGVWGAILPAQTAGSLLDYYVEAVTAAGAARYEPYTAELEASSRHVLIDWPRAPGAIVINEFVAQNVTGPVDENSQHEDWVELYNTTNQPVDIGGMWLSDSAVVQKFQIPANTVVPPNGVVRIWCDEDGTQGPLHANFKLSTSGELLALWDNTGTVLNDLIVFGQQQADVSTGRLYDGGLPWVTFPEPSYRLRNELAGCGQRTYGSVAPTQHGVTLTAGGSLRIGTTANYAVSTGPANGLGIFAMSLLGDHVALAGYGLGDETLLLSPTLLVVPAALTLDGLGASSTGVALPNNAAFAGIRLYAQTLTIAGTSYDSSRAVEVQICP